jgi:CRISPR-associated protein Cas2
MDIVMVVVSYDVSTIRPAGRRRLRRVARACKNWGQRVQYSVFECVVDATQWTRLRKSLLDIFDPGEDSLRFYFLGANWKPRVEHHGIKSVLDIEGPLIT